MTSSHRVQALLLISMAISSCSGFSSQRQRCSHARATASVPLQPPEPIITSPLATRSRLWMTSSFFLEDPSSSSDGMTAMSATTERNNEDDNSNDDNSLRGTMRRITGFSLTAFRATMRAATGISLTAVYASTLAATSAWVRKLMAAILSPLPPWFRYFFQPLLILYYVPLFLLRSLAGPTGKEARETHEVFVDSFKAAVDAAEMKVEGYWPPLNTDDDEK